MEANSSRRSWNDLSSQQQSVRSTVQQSDNKIIDAFSNNDESPNTMNLNGDALSFGTTPPLPPPVLRKPIRIVKTVNSTTTTTTTSSSNNNNKNWNTDLLTTSMISDSKLQHQQNGNQNLNLLKTTTTSRPLAVSKTYSLAKTGLFSATPFNTSSMTSKLNENYHKTTNGMPETTNANNINDDTPKLNVDMKQQHGKNDNKEILSSSSNHVHTPLRRYKSREEYEFETNLKAYASRHPNNKQLYNLALSPTDHRLSTDYTRNLFPMPDRMRRLRSRFNSGERLDSISIQSYSPDYLQRTVFSDSIDSSNIQAEELILSLQRRLQTLKENRREITNETEENILLGNRLIGIVEKSAQASEVEKFKLHINEIDTITNLLLKLSSRLAKVENDIQCLQENIDERTKNCLIERRDEMQLKYDEARTLKDGIDRRSRLVCDILRKYLNDEQYADYDYYIKMKSTLHMDLKDIEEQIQLIEKQIQLLNLSLTIKTSPLTPSLVFEGVSDSLTSSTSPPTTTNMLPTYFKTISTSA
ncbi:unnamed protein product [Didymodactylos carnosus]|uniref:ASD2 domain-containing protein n=1 Tax=Didymodactylos carnosus TaxID=1234261 RepID=A0A8S2HU24_9BILA|nr:unnamed protein product [Didymodactylos carnosus]CAF3681474.1 unnamed protein product [Didymodactylos carnosus]